MAEEIDGTPVPGAPGRQTLELVAYFAHRAEAVEWLEAQRAGGFVPDGPTPLATLYHGPTDSPSNAWSARATRELEPDGLAATASRRVALLAGEQAPEPAEPELTPAELAAAVVDGLVPQVSRETLLELHGALVVLTPANPILDALLTELEAAYMGRPRPVAS